MTLTQKRGRPRLNPEQRKRNNVTLRLRDKLKQQLAEQADANGRSLSEEMEYRLEYSIYSRWRWPL
jgi:predicted HicB family RNase H-like nuclease